MWIISCPCHLSLAVYGGPFLSLTRRDAVGSALTPSATSPVGRIIDKLGEQSTEVLQEWGGKLCGYVGSCRQPLLRNYAPESVVLTQLGEPLWLKAIE